MSKRTLEERLWSKVTRGDGCWLWTGYRNRDGYGSINLGSGANVMLLTHRVSWTLAHGEIPTGQYVCHHCDTPACVRPDHLFLGDQSANMKDGVAKGRVHLPAQDGSNNPQAKLTEAQVLAIRERYAAGGILHRELAPEFGVSVPTIAGIVRGEYWPHVGGPRRHRVTRPSAGRPAIEAGEGSPRAR
jgi:hypothetical protein